MELDRYVGGLQRQLATAAAAGGTEARELAERLTAPLESAVRLTLLEALSEAAGEITAELAPGSVDVRLRGGDPEFVVSRARAAEPSPAAAAAPAPLPAAVGTDADEGTTTRTTLRLPDHLKSQVETAAARDGISVNTWLVRAVATVLEQVPGPASQVRTEQRGSSTVNRVTGWVR